jgi:hypothetical protein
VRLLLECVGPTTPKPFGAKHLYPARVGMRHFPVLRIMMDLRD